ncbi:[citrate (pro-3S)-lyase] ligase [Haloimpatiens sp. FM7330]|uniref:[citrate (pro-3S)-lyase] ligase n=1 Tax=Haloimpatiens sp. FM7330 TaxID=3298610 RepID=UPI00362A8541
MYDLKLQKINLKDYNERQEVNEFLNKFDLILDNDVDYTIVLRDKGNKIAATCSKAKSVFKCFAIDPKLQGDGITSKLITDLINKSFEEGVYHNFIFTKPKNIEIFSSLNFKLIYEVEKVALLENGVYNINNCLNNLIKKNNINITQKKSAIVMNCNPFTLGHKYLIEQASKQSEEVLVFIVQENKSLFPFDVRYSLVKKGVAHLRNVKVVPGTEYIISSATFPSYFLRKEDERLQAYTKLDANIFGEYFCKKLNIVRRFVGEEPYCNVTREYNKALKNQLYKYGIELEQLKRKEINDTIISASKVRELIRNNEIEEISKFVPRVTLEFFNTDKGKEIMEKIKYSNSPH